MLKNENICFLSKFFFEQPNEIIFRSLTNLIQKLGKKYYPVRGKSINELIETPCINLKDSPEVPTLYFLKYIYELDICLTEVSPIAPDSVGDFDVWREKLGFRNISNIVFMYLYNINFVCLFDNTII